MLRVDIFLNIRKMHWQYFAISVQSGLVIKTILSCVCLFPAKNSFLLIISGFKFDVRGREEAIASYIGAKQKNKDKGGKGGFIGPRGRALRI